MVQSLFVALVLSYTLVLIAMSLEDADNLNIESSDDGAEKEPQQNPLEAILEAQEGGLRYHPTIHEAAAEIKEGRKRSCWMWYIWPSYSVVRKHRRPEMLLANLHDHVEYLKHPELGRRLVAITRMANNHLQTSSPRFVFGYIDDEKFFESASAFAIAAEAMGKEAWVKAFIASLPVFNGISGKVVDALRKDTSVEGAEQFVDNVLKLVQVAPEKPVSPSRDFRSTMRTMRNTTLTRQPTFPVRDLRTKTKTMKQGKISGLFNKTKKAKTIDPTTGNRYMTASSVAFDSSSDVAESSEPKNAAPAPKEELPVSPNKSEREVETTHSPKPECKAEKTVSPISLETAISSLSEKACTEQNEQCSADDNLSSSKPSPISSMGSIAPSEAPEAVNASTSGPVKLEETGENACPMEIESAPFDEPPPKAYTVVDDENSL